MEYILQISWMHCERENENLRISSSFFAWAARGIELPLPEMRNSEFVEEEQELSWRHVDFEMPIRSPCKQVQGTVRCTSQNSMGD